MEKCKNCGTEKSKSAITFLLNDMAIYEPYCYDCAKAQIIKEYKIEPEKLNSKNIKRIAEVLELGKLNTLINDPVKWKKIAESKEYQELAGKLGD